MWELVKGAVWVVVWELLKQGGSFVLKRKGDRADSKRKMVRDDLLAACEAVNACLASADEYYTSHCSKERRGELGRAIRRGMHALSQKLTAINLGLSHIGAPQLDANLTVRFRQALTMELDRADWQPMPENDPLVTAMYRAAQLLSLEISKARYSCA